MISIIGDILVIIAFVSCCASKIINIKQKNPQKVQNVWIEKYGNIIFGCILLISAIILLLKLDKIPQGLHVDEAGAFYDAMCISKYGVDRYLYKLPVYFINFGGGQNALYTYLTAIMIKLFGASIFIFRLPAVILSLISVICFYKIISENNSKKEALFSTIILVLCPWFIMKSRWGLESYLMCSMMMISTTVFMKALSSKKSYIYVLSGILFGITLYTYAISYMVIPLVLGIIILYNF